MSKELNNAPVEQAGGDERAAFERAFTVQEGIYFDDKRGEYRSMNLRAIEATDAQDLNLRLQGWQARAALAQPSPVRSSLLINGYQLRAALDFIAPDGTAEQLESEACIEWRQQDADFLEAGLYAFCAEYPEEGGVLLDEEPTTAQPSPLQSEQAEAERPEVVARVVHSNPVVLEQCAPLNANDEMMTFAQHAASVARWAEMFNRVEQERDAANARLHEVATACATAEQERDAALAEVERLRESKGDPSGSFDRCMKMMYERDENAKRLDAALARLSGLRSLLNPILCYVENDIERMRGDRDKSDNKEIYDLAISLAMERLKAAQHAVFTTEPGCDTAVELASHITAQAQHSVPEEFIGRLSEFLAQRGATGKALLRELRTVLAAAPGKEGV
ncbi:hypothetical protein [Pseudomonas aeruginosa]|uniref:hypothetical protein n=1 Tax=Pseudomonas aeruginosa TaxID=287 RepID=UPI0032E48544